MFLFGLIRFGLAKSVTHDNAIRVWFEYNVNQNTVKLKSGIFQIVLSRESGVIRRAL